MATAGRQDTAGQRRAVAARAAAFGFKLRKVLDGRPFSSAYPGGSGPAGSGS